MSATVILRVDGREISAIDGEALIGALHAAGVLALRESPREGLARGAFCFMGACQECRVRVGDRIALACRESVRAGLEVKLGERG